MLQLELKNKLSLTDFPNEVNLDELVTNIDITRMEDVLTSNVFGIIKNIKVDILNTILTKSGIDYNFEQTPVYKFWERFDNNTEPDIIVFDNKCCVVIEVKYHSGFQQGDKKNKPQIIREIEGAKKDFKNRKIFFLAVTKNEIIRWKENVHPHYNSDIINLISDKILFHISWLKIFDILQDTIDKDLYAIDDVSKNFINDLIKYLKNKEIGFTKPHKKTGSRNLQFFFGEEINELEAFVNNNDISNINKKSYDIYLSNLSIEDKENLYSKIKNVIESLKKQNKLKITRNEIQTNSVTSDLLLINDEKEIGCWINFITYLFNDKYVNLNGISDISAKLIMKSGKYINKSVSLFTYYKKKRKLTITKLR